MTESHGSHDREIWFAPALLGYARAATAAHFVAAPLLTAAALSLAGVVASSDNDFLWPGPILLLLVISAVALIAAIQLGYHSRLYLYSHQDLHDWYSTPYVEDNWGALRKDQAEHQKTWSRYSNAAVRCFNAGTLLLGLGIAASLAPGSRSAQANWRWAAAVVVFLCTMAEAVWLRRLNSRVYTGPSLRTVLTRRARRALHRLSGRGDAHAD